MQIAAVLGGRLEHLERPPRPLRHAGHVDPEEEVPPDAGAARLERFLGDHLALGVAQPAAQGPLEPGSDAGHLHRVVDDVVGTRMSHADEWNRHGDTVPAQIGRSQRMLGRANALDVRRPPAVPRRPTRRRRHRGRRPRDELVVVVAVHDLDVAPAWPSSARTCRAGPGSLDRAVDQRRAALSDGDVRLLERPPTDASSSTRKCATASPSTTNTPPPLTFTPARPSASPIAASAPGSLSRWI